MIARTARASGAASGFTGRFHWALRPTPSARTSRAGTRAFASMNCLSVWCGLGPWLAGARTATYAVTPADWRKMRVTARPRDYQDHAGANASTAIVPAPLARQPSRDLLPRHDLPAILNLKRQTGLASSPRFDLGGGRAEPGIPVSVIYKISDLAPSPWASRGAF